MKSDMRDVLADQSFEEKIRKVGELIQLSRKVKTSSDDALLARLDKAAAELDAGKGVSIARVREDIQTWPKNSKKRCCSGDRVSPNESTFVSFVVK